LGEHLINAAYSRKAETKADLYAIHLLQKSGISTKGMGAFFERMHKKSTHNHDDSNQHTLKIFSYLSSHPDIKSRAELVNKTSQDPSLLQDMLTPQEWHAIKTACSKSKPIS